MESKEVLLNGRNPNGSLVVSYENVLVEVNGESRLEHVGGDKMGKGSLADEVLEDLEEYWEDINERLTISRMVGDSVIKGIVTAMEQEAAERIRINELDVANCKECLRSIEAGSGIIEPVRLSMEWKAAGFGNVTDSSMEHDKMREELHALRDMASEQFEKAKKEIDCARGCNSIKKIGSCSELVGLGGILQEKQSESWLCLDNVLGSLKSTVDTVCTEVDSILRSSKDSLFERQHELDVSGKIEDIVIQSVVKSLQEEFEEKLWEHNTQKYVNWLEKLDDISGLRIQLDSIVKSLSLTEAGLVSHGSHDLDHLQHKALSKENGTLEVSKTQVSESYDFNQLKHMNSGELVNYFNNIITNLKRDHETALHEMTEKYFCLKREILKERGSSVTHKKDEEFDVLRKKIPEVIMKLENFLSQSERFPKLEDDVESLAKLKDRLECLLAENRGLRDCLSDKKKEVKYLEAQVSGVDGKLFQQSLAEENVWKLVADLKSDVEDSRIEASLNEEVYKCALKELMGQMKCEALAVEFSITEAVLSAETRGVYEAEDSDIETVIAQEVSGLIFREALKDVNGKLSDLHQELLIMKENEICVETKVLERNNELRREVEENERLKQELLVLETKMEQKENLAADLSISLSKKREQLEVASAELSCLREDLRQQQTMAADKNKESESLSGKLLEAMEQMEIDNVKMVKLNQKLYITNDLLIEANKERDMAFALAQERLDKLLLSEATKEKLKEEMELSVINIHGLSKIFNEFEYRISEAIMENNKRLKDTASHLKALTTTTTVLRTAMLMYKQKLELRCADLQTAEAEVDLLGDEVDALLRLLEKIYIALDHYSPILKHYPGIMEILELVRRELSGESTKPSRSTPWQSKMAF